MDCGMELFAAAGIDLPLSGTGARSARPSIRSLRVPLFSHKVLKQARSLAAFAPTPEQLSAAAEYAASVRNTRFLKQKETSVRPVFIQQILRVVLGYKTIDATGMHTLAFEHPVRRGAVDVALGRFGRHEEPDDVRAPFELKGPDTFDLDKIVPGRGRSPVQQAWDYAIDAPGSRWVLVSNCVEIRLYGFGRGRDAYEVFDLSRLDEFEEHARLWLVLSQDRFLGGDTDRLLRDTDSVYRDVTSELYAEYKALRDKLVSFLVGSADGPRLPFLGAIETAQKVLDRILFIAFAQRTDLLPDGLLKRALTEENAFVPQPIWMNFLSLFRAVDRGNDRLSISAYNGGLFAKDEVADGLILPDHLAVEVAALGKWDFGSEVPVTVLGHIFEQSITDIEGMKARQSGSDAPDISKRKRDGVVYTPDMVTRFLVEQTIGVTLRERFLHLQTGVDENSQDGERALLLAYLDVLRNLAVLDPACGSGAFLVAAFDELAREYRAVVGRLTELGEAITFDIFDQILTRNLYGVDVNAESVEITRLSLWLKTARRQHKLQNLESTVKVGNSLIDDAAFSDRPFDWRAAFPQVFENGGFDIVIGNPPYVRMETIKPFKPYLEKHYVVAADRADLYAYFFEKGIKLLKDGGRLGYISSSTFFRTGSGENLRVFLIDKVALEAVVDFGDLQLFDGFTTYPAILTLQKGVADGRAGDLRFLNVEAALPDNLGQLFTEKAQSMPRARLGAGSWQFEGAALAALRDKISAGRKTLGEVYGPPLYGIKTGLNKAFVIDTPTRDRLLKADPKSADLLKPFLRGEDIKRWRVESEGLWLINTPKGKVDIEAYPAVKAWLWPFKAALERRATRQAWWELQQAQLAYQDKFCRNKLVFPDISLGPRFASDENNSFIDCTVFTVGDNAFDLLAYLNSRCGWYFFENLTPEIRGGFVRLKTQYVSQLPIPDMPPDVRARLASLGQSCTEAARRRHDIQASVRHRLVTDLATGDRRKLTGRLENWHDLDFAGFMTEIAKAFGADIPLKQRAMWESYLAENRAELATLSSDIRASETAIDQIVYALFDLTPDEIALLQASLDGAL